ncbi:MAG: FixH family protein [Roseomonas sp.]|nr:FixH family protein [Roseomonas sp.]MCA3331234.1 FixH family protein [Roseomonas sp.]MCA3334768.1 FixH family protein [Roseomonas sp.]MCA3347178.1 FixH family protein [Roseomonas sp.]MCA3352834.1 FixH family protein [Roseomonas sp.]
MSTTIQRDYDPKRGRWIPWVFVGGMALVVAVNALLVWFSLSTFTGVTVPRAYERGRGYDQVLAEAARQDALGWRGEISLEAGILRLVMQDAQQQPLHGRVEGIMLRPLEGNEVPLGFNATGHGRFAARLEPLRAGQWEARLTFFDEGGTAFDLRKRFILP